MTPLRERASYVYFKSIETRWMDNDIYGHVNNVSYYSYFDSVANCFLIDKANFDIHKANEVGFVVSSKCDYFAPIAYPETIEAAFKVNKIGTKSVEYGLAIFSRKYELACAVGSFTHVFVDRDTQMSVPIPEAIRNALMLASKAEQ